jgi:hypothetical protein
MLGLERDALAGRGPILPGLKDIGIREGTFTFLLGVVVAGVGCGAMGCGRGDGGVVDTVGCEAAGVGAGVVDDADVVCWDRDVAVEDS